MAYGLWSRGRPGKGIIAVEAWSQKANAMIKIAEQLPRFALLAAPLIPPAQPPQMFRSIQ